jgi:hypothetical protein
MTKKDVKDGLKQRGMSANPLAGPQEPQITQTSSSGQGEDHEK